MRATDFLDTARELLKSSRGAPRQANLRKACSATYYALFHTLCTVCADSLTVRGTRRAWLQVYRAVEHGVANKRCKEIADRDLGFPDEIKDFANMFCQMQIKRHTADYDPSARFYKSEVETDIKVAETIITAFRNTELRHRRAFATYILIKTRQKSDAGGK